MNTNLPSWILPVGACALAGTFGGWLLGPAIGLTQSAGTGWGLLVGAAVGGLIALIRR